MVKETDAVIFFVIKWVLIVWNSVQVLTSLPDGINDDRKKMRPKKRTPSQLKKMLKNDLVELIIQYQ